jgi:beta-galactosidase/beta-glucuronidase
VTHPRPQLTRARWTDLCGEWQFSFDDDVFDRTIMVPFPPESKASGIAETGYHPVLWYRRTFTADPGQDRLLLHFGAVDYRAKVWVNGVLVAEHEGGHTPFHADITSALISDTDQVLVVRAEDQPTDVEAPRGKQDWQPEPHVIWYHRTTGIWQPVWLEQVPATHIEAVRWTTRPSQSRIEADLDISGPGDLTIHVCNGPETVAKQTTTVHGPRVHLTLDIPALHHGQDHGHLLWSPDHPTLLDVDLTLTTETSTDTASSYLGLREVGVRDGRFTLNGHPYFLRMVLEQGYWPDSHLAAPDDDTLRQEVELIKSLGFNGARLHQKVEDPRFLYHCDRLGLLVWGEMPSAYQFSATTIDRVCREWTQVVLRDAAHPCVVAWVPINESWSVQNIATEPAQQHFASALYHLTKALDPTRPVISNDGWEHTVSDIYGLHDYSPSPESLATRYADPAAIDAVLAGPGPMGRKLLLGDRDPQVPVMITEYGGLSYRPTADEQWHGYATLPDAEALLARYTELTGALLASTALAGFCYTQLTDTLQETNGLLTDRREPKLDPAAIRAANRRPAAAVPVEELEHAYEQARE